jgi:hypothetical protein
MYLNSRIVLVVALGLLGLVPSVMLFLSGEGPAVVGVVLSLLGLVPPLVMADEQASQALHSAQLVPVKGALSPPRLMDYDGRLVMAVVPSQWSGDRQSRSAADAGYAISHQSMRRPTGAGCDIPWPNL